MMMMLELSRIIFILFPKLTKTQSAFMDVTCSYLVIVSGVWTGVVLRSDSALGLKSFIAEGSSRDRGSNHL